MNKLSLIFFFIVSSIISQNNIEIYLFDITKTIDGYELNHKINISNNEGLAVSQPQFALEIVLKYISVLHHSRLIHASKHVNIRA